MHQNPAERQHQRAAGTRHDLCKREKLHALGAAEHRHIAGTAHIGGAHPGRDSRFQRVKSHFSADQRGGQGNSQDDQDDGQEVKGGDITQDGFQINERRPDAPTGGPPPRAAQT